MRDHLLLAINGVGHRVEGREAFGPLSSFLRDSLGLQGTQLACAEGGCGSCSVLVGVRDGHSRRYQLTNSCITPLYRLDRSHVVTIEGLGSATSLHPAQRAIVDHHASQCGYCTAGFAMALAASTDASDPSSLRRDLAGNLCRCTGYWQLLEAGASLESASNGGLEERYPEPELRSFLDAHSSEELHIEDGAWEVHAPTTLAGAAHWLAQRSDATVVGGATDLREQVREGARRPARILALGPQIPGYGDASMDEEGLLLGAGATWSRVLELVRKPLPELAKILECFGSPQIRNAGTLGGSVATGSAVADILPCLFVLGARMEIVGSSGRRQLSVEEFCSHPNERRSERSDRNPRLEADELIASFRVPLPRSDQRLRLYRVSRRRDLDTPTVNAGILITLKEDRIGEARIGIGGGGPRVRRLHETEAFLKGLPFDETSMRAAGEVARSEIEPISDIRGSAAYRSSLVANLLLKSYFDPGADPTPRAPAPSMTNEGDASPAHRSARALATGAAPFVANLPRLERELTVGFVGSPVARGVLDSLDLTAARAIEGVVGIFTHDDLPGARHFGAVVRDEPVLADGEVSYRGQPLAVIAAESRDALERAREAISIQIADDPPILSLDDAVEERSFIGPERGLERGNLAAGWGAAHRRIEGRFASGGQEHFYLEPQAALAWPGEDGEIQIHASTQNPSEIQRVVAEALGLGRHQIVCQVKRVGGAFGGKETQANLPALMAALVVHRTGRPARIQYDRAEDARVTGKRHPFRTRYALGIDEAGRIVAAEFEFLTDAGAFADLCDAVVDRFMLHIDNAYHLPNIRVRGRVCRTNHPPNTAFRGFGAPQAMAVIENAVQEIAIASGLDALEIRRVNAYEANLDSAPASSGSDAGVRRCETPYGQIVRNNLLPEIFDRLEQSASYAARMREVESANRLSPTRLRGLAMVPVKFGISFVQKFLNQANALVNVYADGTVQVSTGATELGQGVNTKLAQLVAEAFGIDLASVIVMPTSTEKNNNTSPTAASTGTDLNGAAALDAASQIRIRLATLASRLLAEGEAAPSPSPDCIRFEAGEVFDERATSKRLSFADLAQRAHRERIDLGARGFYATPGLDFDPQTGRGSPFRYFTTGCAVASVGIDRLTGELTIERLDVLMDLGRILNLGVERGQVIGGLVQGIGWVTSEQLIYDERGELLTTTPASYKIPTVGSLPESLNIDFLENRLDRELGISTKAAGEPPLMLGLAVWAAIKHALSFVAPGEIPDLGLPATHEEILRCIEELERRGGRAQSEP